MIASSSAMTTRRVIGIPCASSGRDATPLRGEELLVPSHRRGLNSTESSIWSTRTDHESVEQLVLPALELRDAFDQGLPGLQHHVHVPARLVVLLRGDRGLGD